MSMISATLPLVISSWALGDLILDGALPIPTLIALAPH